MINYAPSSTGLCLGCFLLFLLTMAHGRRKEWLYLELGIWVFTPHTFAACVSLPTD